MRGCEWPASPTGTPWRDSTCAPSRRAPRTLAHTTPSGLPGRARQGSGRATLGLALRRRYDRVGVGVDHPAHDWCELRLVVPVVLKAREPSLNGRAQLAAVVGSPVEGVCERVDSLRGDGHRVPGVDKR